MKDFINSDKMKWFRKGFLTAIYNAILSCDDKYCCHVFSWHKWFICWKELKEVKENMDSQYIWAYHKRLKTNLDCRHVWFDYKYDRLQFLEECLAKLNE